MNVSDEEYGQNTCKHKRGIEADWLTHGCTVEQNPRAFFAGSLMPVQHTGWQFAKFQDPKNVKSMM
jgi:hypothetical protein